MSRLTIRIPSELQQTTLDALEPVKLKGKIADVYLQFANGESALRAYLQMESSLREGSLTIAELEAIKLWVSQQTGCHFCLSVHTVKASQAGLDESQQMSIRQGQKTGDLRMDMLLRIAAVVFKTPGSIPQELLDDARAAGLSDANLVDLTMAMATIFFTNMTNHINDSQSSLPPAPALI